MSWSGRLSSTLAERVQTLCSRIASPLSLPTSVGLVLFATAFITLACFVPERLLNDPDTGWHVRTGQWILENRQLPRTDPFSHTFFGKPWIAKEWLSQVFLASAFMAGGWNGVTILAAAACAGIAGLVGAYAARILRLSIALGLAGVTFLLLSPHLLARPHVFGYVALCVWLWCLLDAHDSNKPFPAALVAVIVVWANLHSTFALGLLILYAFAAARIAACWRDVATVRS